jgi:protein-S-isoprenylcysteine O-methyltransferase Ste14
MRKTEEEIKQSYAKRRKWINVVWLLNFTLLPLLGVLYLVFRESEVLSKVIMVSLGAYCAFAIFVMWIIWRCPGCHIVFSGYVFDPKECPYCGVKLR